MRRRNSVFGKKRDVDAEASTAGRACTLEGLRDVVGLHARSELEALVVSVGLHVAKVDAAAAVRGAGAGYTPPEAAASLSNRLFVHIVQVLDAAADGGLGREARAVAETAVVEALLRQIRPEIVRRYLHSRGMKASAVLADPIALCAGLWGAQAAHAAAKARASATGAPDAVAAEADALSTLRTYRRRYAPEEAAGGGAVQAARGRGGGDDLVAMEQRGFRLEYGAALTEGRLRYEAGYETVGDFLSATHALHTFNLESRDELTTEMKRLRARQDHADEALDATAGQLVEVERRNTVMAEGMAKLIALRSATADHLGAAQVRSSPLQSP